MVKKVLRSAEKCSELFPLSPLPLCPASNGCHGSFLGFPKHAFREVPCGFCRGTVPGATLVLAGAPRMPKNKSQEACLVPAPKSGVAPANQTKKSQFMNFPQGRSGTKVRDVNRAFFPKEKHQNSQKWAEFMNFSFWPFLWFGLPGRLLTKAR